MESSLLHVLAQVFVISFLYLIGPALISVLLVNDPPCSYPRYFPMKLVGTCVIHVPSQVTWGTGRPTHTTLIKTLSLNFLILQFKTKYGKRVIQVTVTVNDTLYNSTNGTQEVMEITREEVIPVPGQVNGVNALGLVVFSMCFGLIIGNMKEQGQLLRDFFDSLNEAIMRLVAIIMW